MQAGSPTHLFDTSTALGANRYVPSPNGKRFLFSVETDGTSPAEIVVVLGWADHLTSILRTR